MLALQRLLQSRDFAMITETHSNSGCLLGYCSPPGVMACWSSGPAAKPGIGVLLKDNFLQQFHDHSPISEEPSPGRLASLRLGVRKALWTW